MVKKPIVCLKNWKLKKKFLPINGYDLLNVGFIKGRKMGKALLEIEKWWIKNKFKPNKKQCLNFAKKKLTTNQLRR